MNITFAIVIIIALVMFIFFKPSKPKNHNENIADPIDTVYRPLPLRAVSQVNGQDRWQTSPRGNPTFSLAGLCVTVFSQEHVWTYSIAEIDNDDPSEVFFSDRYASIEKAKIAAMEDFLDRIDN